MGLGRGKGGCEVDRKGDGTGTQRKDSPSERFLRTFTEGRTLAEERRWRE